MTTIASYAIVALLLTSVVQYLKKKFPVHALIILAGLAMVCAGGYQYLTWTGNWETFAANSVVLISTANLVFNVFKAFYDGAGGDDSTVHADT